MADTAQLKRDIRDTVKGLSDRFHTTFHEGNILGSKESRKFHGVSADGSICLFVCNNELQDGKVKAGQRASIFEKCYWLTIGDRRRRILVFTNRDFHNGFMEQYSEYLSGIETMVY